MHESPRKPRLRDVRTLNGYGWLSESSRNVAGWNAPRSKSDLRKCVFMPMPPSAVQQAMSVEPLPPIAAKPVMPRPTPKAHSSSVEPSPRRRNPARDVRIFPIYDAVAVARQYQERKAAEQAHLAAQTPLQTQTLAYTRPSAPSLQGMPVEGAPFSYAAPPMSLPAVTADRKVWWEAPAFVGAMLLLVPPVGVAILWTSRRYGTEARIALTIMTAVTMCLVSVVMMAFALARFH